MLSKAKIIKKRRIATIWLILLAGGFTFTVTFTACVAQLTSPPQEQGEFSVPAAQPGPGEPSWPDIEELLAKIPPEELKQPIEEDFLLIGPGDRVVRLPRPPMDKETALRLWWEASRRAWGKILQRFRATLAESEGQDPRFLNDPSFKARMQEENHKILAEELRKVLAEWQKTQGRSPQP